METTFDNTALESILMGLEAQQSDLVRRIRHLQLLLSGGSSPDVQPRRRRSPEVIKRMAEAQKRRWAGVKAFQKRAAATSTKNTKRSKPAPAPLPVLPTVKRTRRVKPVPDPVQVPDYQPADLDFAAAGASE